MPPSYYTLTTNELIALIVISLFAIFIIYLEIRLYLCKLEIERLKKQLSLFSNGGVSLKPPKCQK